MGVGEDETLGDAVSVTIIATGFNIEQQKTIVTTSEPQLIIHTLGDDQKVERDLSGDLGPSRINFSTPDQPLSGVNQPLVAQEEVEEKKVYSLEDSFDDKELTIRSVDLDREEQGAIGEKTQDLDVFFEIVTPVSIEAEHYE